MGTKQINFKFAKNWKAFLYWYAGTKQKGVSPNGAPWEAQKKVITDTFEVTVPNIVDWLYLWTTFEDWYKVVLQKKGMVEWSEQRREIETLMLEQLKSLNEETFCLAYLLRGKPAVDTELMTYWEAVRVKKELEGDKNGSGGNEDLDKITILNLNKLIR